MATLQDLSDKIKEKLNTLTWAWEPLAVVFDYHTLDNNGQYPYVSFEAENWESEIQDTCNNMETHNFGIYLFQETTKQTRSLSKWILYNAVNDIIRMFEKDYTLWWIANGGTSQSWEFLNVVDAEWKILLAKINLLCKIQVDINQ